LKKLTPFERRYYLRHRPHAACGKDQNASGATHRSFSPTSESRRRFSGEWQAYVDEVLRDELPGQFLGNVQYSSCQSERRCSYGNFGARASNGRCGLLENCFVDWLSEAQRAVLEGWWEEYGYGLSIFLPDTFGSDFFLNNLTEDDLAQ